MASLGSAAILDWKAALNHVRKAALLLAPGNNKFMIVQTCRDAYTKIHKDLQ